MEFAHNKFIIIIIKEESDIGIQTREIWFKMISLTTTLGTNPYQNRGEPNGMKTWNLPANPANRRLVNHS